jgi:hypothetical protein
MAMLKMLTDNGFPLTKENILRMNQALKLTADGIPNPGKALFMIVNQMKLTTANAAQLEGFVSGEVNITNQLNNLQQAIRQLNDPVLSVQLMRILTGTQETSQTQSGLNQNIHPQNTGNGSISFEMNNPPRQATVQVQATLPAQPGVNNTSVLNINQLTNLYQTVQQTITQSNVNQSVNNQQIAPTVQQNISADVAPSIQQNISADATPSVQPNIPTDATPPVQLNIPANVAPQQQVLSVVSTLTDANLITNTPPANTPQNISPNPNIPETAQNPQQNTPSPLAEPLQANFIQPNPIQTNQNNPSQSSMLVTPNNDTPQQIQSSTPQSSTPQMQSTINNSPDIQPQPTPPTPLTFRLSDNTPTDIDRFLNNLRDNINQIRQIITESNTNTPDTNRVLLEIRAISDHIDFTAQIRNPLYVQLPLYHNGHETPVSLFVYKDTNKTTEGNKDTASALIALDTAALGHFETYVQKNGNSVICQFRLDNAGIEQKVRNHIHELETLLRNHQFSLSGFSFTAPGKPYTLLDSPSLFDVDFQLPDEPLPRFDKRA